MDKTYTGVFVIGQTTPSSDLETTPGEAKPVGHITPGDLEKAAQALTGPQQQTPPLYSAKKINGERAYHHARQGLQTQMQPRDIRVESFEITRVNLPEVHFRITCSKGTYIRSLARDFGDILQTGAYLGASGEPISGSFRWTTPGKWTISLRQSSRATCKKTFCKNNLTKAFVFIIFAPLYA